MSAARATVDYKYRTGPAADGEVEAEGKTADADDDSLQDMTAYSSTPGRVDILSQQVYDRVAASHLPQVSAVVLAAVMLVLGPYFAYSSAVETNNKAAKSL